MNKSLDFSELEVDARVMSDATFTWKIHVVYMSVYELAELFSAF